MGAEPTPRLAASAPLSRRAPARRQKPIDRPSSLKLWLRRRRGMARPAALGLLGLVLLGGTGAAIWAADPAGRVRGAVEWMSEVGLGFGMTIQRVEIVGRQHTPLDMIGAALGVSRGDPLLGFSLEAARARLETIAWVQRAHIERHLPDGLVIHIEERRPFAIWQRDGRFVVIDREGRVIAQDRLDQFGPLPLVVGPGANQMAASLYELFEDLPDIAPRVQAMVRIGERRWNLKLHNGTDVLLPEGAEAAAIARLAALQREQRLLDRPLAAIDMRLPDRLVLRQVIAPGTPDAPRPTGVRRGA